MTRSAAEGRLQQMAATVLVGALAGAGIMQLMSTDRPGEENQDMAPLVEEVGTQEQAAGEVLPATTAPAPDVAGVPAAVSALLSEYGIAETVPPQDLASALPESVLEFLSSRDAVLQLPNPEDAVSSEAGAE